jgi:hypothetical protein
MIKSELWNAAQGAVTVKVKQPCQSIKVVIEKSNTSVLDQLAESFQKARAQQGV